MQDARADAEMRGPWPPTVADAVERQAALDVPGLLAASPAHGLLAAMTSALTAMAPVLPAAAPRLGLVDRLLGRDLMAAADTRPADVRVRLALHEAECAASALATHLSKLEDASARLAEDLDAARSALVASEAGTHAQLRLQALATGWALALSQLQQVRVQATHLLDSHARLRDMLVPLWRAQATPTADAAGAARFAAQLDELLRTLPMPPRNAP